MPQSQLSVQLYTVRDALAADLPGTLKRVADLGYRNIELAGFVDLADQYRELLPSLGLAAPSAHVGLLGHDVADVFAAAKKVGVSTLIDGIDEARWQSREGIASAAAELNAVARIAVDHGLTVGYHNHAFEAEIRIDGSPALEVFADYLDSAVVLEVDTYWVEVGGVSSADLLRRLGERVQLLHIKDGPGTADPRGDQVAVGSGSLDILDILAAAPHALRVVEFDSFDGDIFEALRDSFAYLTANGVTA